MSRAGALSGEAETGSPEENAINPPQVIQDARAFVLENTRLRQVPLVPEISLHLADEAVPLWTRTEEQLEAVGLPPPFWAFAWAGGQALARYLLDDPQLVAERRVLDLATGSGLVAIAAAEVGAAPVVASDIDAFAEAAVALNCEANGVYAEVLRLDLLDLPPPLERRYDVILVGDLFYEKATAARALAFLDRHAALGSRVLIGDPGRSYLPRARLDPCREYQVPVTRDLEDQEIKRTMVWSLRRA